ncbi:hypothetical protein CVT25_000692 [Psilocybe cyanescens]|uniref:Uncharacterized protein n=1 Tax=Psilocybe cyanescens TaxID=93625 RepID=A0A409WZP2_PSICY|nr:hypothetical protein CVT25_000692 [Psilocybe cyanescens]
MALEVMLVFPVLAMWSIEKNNGAMNLDALALSSHVIASIFFRRPRASRRRYSLFKVQDEWAGLSFDFDKHKMPQGESKAYDDCDTLDGELVQFDFDQHKTPQGEVKAYKSCDILDGEPCLPCQQSIKLEAQIVEANGPALDDLLILKRNLRTEINSYHDPIIRRLPPELTSRVFEVYCEEDEEQDGWEIPPYLPSSPLVLGAVCQTWRRIAWSSPPLWTCIHISIKPRMKDAHVDEVEEWLQRSGQLPLSMVIEFFPSNIPTNARFCRLISIINQHSNHWQSLYIACYHEQLRLICGNSRGAPILRNLCIGGLDSDPLENYIINPTMNGIKLQPSRVELRHLHLKLVYICWSDITDIILVECCIHLDECIELLRQAPQLISCHIQGIHTPESEDWKATVTSYHQLITHHGLQDLVLEGYQGEDIGMFFQSFTFPHLSNLYLEDIDDYNISLWSSIISLSNRSSVCLTSLAIQNIACDSETLIQILQKLPCLVTLVITPSNTDLQVHQLLSALADAFFLDTLGHYQTPFLPKLQSIQFSNCDSASWDASFWQSISQLSGPWKDGRPTTGRWPLRSVSIRDNGALEPGVASKICADRNILLRLLQLWRSGVQFDLYSNHVDLLYASIQHHGITRRDVPPLGA